MLKTGDLVRAFKLWVPCINHDMIRAAAEVGEIQSFRNPFVTAGDYFFEPASVRAYILGNETIPSRAKREILTELGLDAPRERAPGDDFFSPQVTPPPMLAAC